MRKHNLLIVGSDLFTELSKSDLKGSKVNEYGNIIVTLSMRELHQLSKDINLPIVNFESDDWEERFIDYMNYFNRSGVELTGDTMVDLYLISDEYKSSYKSLNGSSWMIT